MFAVGPLYRSSHPFRKNKRHSVTTIAMMARSIQTPVVSAPCLCPAGSMVDAGRVDDIIEDESDDKVDVSEPALGRRCEYSNTDRGRTKVMGVEWLSKRGPWRGLYVVVAGWDGLAG